MYCRRIFSGRRVIAGNHGAGTTRRPCRLPGQEDRRKTTRTLQFLAIVASALALVPAGAHVAALPNKMAFSEADYFIAQSNYRGWAILGGLWVAALFLDGLLAVLSFAQPWPFRLAAAAACIVLTFAVFFVWTLPANQATQNWTSVSADWQALRRQWECSHAVSAALLLLALGLTTLSALSWRPSGS